MRQIVHDGELFAMIVTEQDFEPGVKFLSPGDWPFQVGLLMLPQGHVIQAHHHREHEMRVVSSTQEFLFVITGRMEVDFYDESGRHFQTEILQPGEALLQVKGGHGFRFPESTRVLEVKQGPYLGRDKDKIPINSPK